MPFKRYTYNGVSVQATARRSSTRDDKKYMREVKQGDQVYLVHYGDPDMPMRRNNEDRQDAFVARHNCSDKTDPTAPGFWACYDWENVNEKSADMEMIGNVVIGSCKALDDNRIGFYAVLFNRVDLQGERFTKSTDFGMQEQIPVLYQHGQDATLKSRSLGVARIVRRDDVGLWLEAQLELRDEYEKAIMQMVKDGKLGVSTGALSHIVHREGGEIKTWWLGEVSLTPIPAEPATQVVALKENVVQSEEEATEAIPEAQIQARVAVVNDESSYIEDTTMTDARMDALETQLKTFGDGLNKVLTLLANEPKVTNSGTLLADGVTGTDATIKSLPDFFLAVKNGNTQRLRQVYNTKDMSDLTGTAGGYLIPEEFNTGLMNLILEQSEFLGLCRTQNVSTGYGRYPVPNYAVVPTANVGQTAFGAGMSAAIRPSGSSYTETQPQMSMVNYTIHSIGGFTDVPKELSADSAFNIEQLFNNLAAQTILAKQEYGVIRGTGIDGYLGFMNADATVQINTDVAGVFDYDDASEIRSRHYMFNQGTTRWIANSTAFQDFAQLQIGSSGNSVLGEVTMNGRSYQTLFTIPIIYNQHMSATNVDGDIALVDFSAYMRFIRSGFSVFFTPHQKATEGLDVFVFDVREDGKPWLNNKITLADGSTTVSPFVLSNYP